MEHQTKLILLWKDICLHKKDNVKPWEEISVGPGLGKGYTSGSGGFNAGMEADSQLPKQLTNKFN